MTNGSAWKATTVNGASPLQLIRCVLSIKPCLSLEQEGGIEARHNRYQTNQTTLVEGMR